MFIDHMFSTNLYISIIIFLYFNHPKTSLAYKVIIVQKYVLFTLPKLLKKKNSILLI